MSLHQALGTRVVDHYARETMGPHDYGSMDGQTAYRVARRRLAEVEARRDDPGRPVRAAGVGALVAVVTAIAWRARKS